jgi:hypothetical protein
LIGGKERMKMDFGQRICPSGRGKVSLRGMRIESDERKD